MIEKPEILKGFCHCGCGEKTTLATSTCRNRGLIKGEPIKFVHGHNMRTRGHHALYADGKFMHRAGYVWTRCDNHPRAHNGYVLEHVVVAEKKLGRLLTPEEEVHHENEIKTDNRPENLVVFKSKSEHAIFHQRLRALRACGNPDWRQCQYCHNYDSLDHLHVNTNSHGKSHFHWECRTIYNRRQATMRKN